MKNLKYLFISSFILLFSFLFISCSKSNETKAIESREKFDTFTNELFVTEVQKDTITLNYSLNNWESYGIEIGDVKIGHFSPSYIESLLATYENYLAILKDISYKDLRPDQQLTYDVLKYYFKLELTQGDFVLYHDVLGPTTGIQAQLPVLFAEFNIKTQEDLDIYLALVKSIEPYFEEVCEFQKLKAASGLFMSKQVADSIISQCENFIKDPEENFLIITINNKISNMDFLSEDEKSKYIKENNDSIKNTLIPAYELLIATLKDLNSTGKNDKGLCYYEKGKSFYEYLIAYNTNSSKSVPELIQMVDLSIEENILEMGDILERNPKVYEELMDISFPLQEPTEIITFLESAVLKDFPEIPSVNCTISYVPESLQEHLSPAMYLVPAIDDYKNNVIYINPEYNMTDVFPTLAHEGYPGHLYQSVYFRDSNPSPIRNLLDFGGYIEGWATYVEYYSYYLAGLEKDVADFIVANMTTNMGIYCRLDFGIHYEGWTFSDSLDYLKSLEINDKELVTLLYETILEEPALYPQYGIGYLEIMELKKKAESKLSDRFSLKDFHTFMLDVGPAPFIVIEERLNEEMLE